MSNGSRQYPTQHGCVCCLPKRPAYFNSSSILMLSMQAVVAPLFIPSLLLLALTVDTLLHGFDPCQIMVPDHHHFVQSSVIFLTFHLFTIPALRFAHEGVTQISLP
ncbi:hypothetical protein IAQ61_001633 [Plenodomus lingam]|uniref:uncharacterized protein n=1 Tax=Leptosphaeria maculans TaxID=5022 RepID=UPI0033335870|nr:hypothetical protein IAQ61_001633 [Plenodomus lingam]